MERFWQQHIKLQNGTTWEEFIDNLESEEEKNMWGKSGSDVVYRSNTIGSLSEDKKILKFCKNTDTIEARDYYYAGEDEAL